MGRAQLKEVIYFVLLWSIYQLTRIYLKYLCKLELSPKFMEIVWSKFHVIVIKQNGVESLIEWCNELKSKDKSFWSIFKVNCNTSIFPFFYLLMFGSLCTWELNSQTSFVRNTIHHSFLSLHSTFNGRPDAKTFWWKSWQYEQFHVTKCFLRLLYCYTISLLVG